VSKQGGRQPSSRARDLITRECGLIVSDQLKRSNLTKAQGDLKITLSGPPPYAIFTSPINITVPNLAELAAAVEDEDVKQIKSLVQQNQNVNQRELPSQRTALFNAVAGRHLKSVRALLDLGADPNIADFEGDTPLKTAVVADSDESVRLLLRAGASVNQANSIGITPLMEAAELGRIDILEILLRWGADTTLMSNKGKTAQTFAREAGKDRAARILLRAGGPSFRR
jgi:ankyrin repeat protein